MAQAWARFYAELPGRVRRSRDIKCPQPPATQAFGGSCWNTPERPLFADTKCRENLAEQVVARELAGELAQARLSVAQVLGGKLERFG
jgi:hypothetical protein